MSNPYGTREALAKSHELIQLIAGPTALADTSETIHVMARVLASYQASQANAKLRNDGPIPGADAEFAFDTYLLALGGAFNVVYAQQLGEMMQVGPRQEEPDNVTDWLRRQMEEGGNAGA